MKYITAVVFAVAVAMMTAGSVHTETKASKPAESKQAKQPRIDLVFCVDTTGSMQDEIDVVKNRMRDMIAKIADGKPVPKVRVGVVAYRDRGDEYVVKKTELTDDLDAAVKTVMELQAGGGGDKEESVNEALHVAVSEMNWDRTAGITRLVYLIGDAGPKVYEQDFNSETERQKAVKDRIIINAIGCSGITDTEVAFFKKMSKGAEGTFANLTYREEYAKADGSRMVVLKEGDKTYKYTASATPGKATTDWKAGSAMAAKTGEAAVAYSYDFDGASLVTTPGTIAKDGWQINAGSINNLDMVMTVQAQVLAAKQQGIKYDKAELVPFLRELQGPKTGVKSKTLTVLRDAKQWKDFWAKHQSYQTKAEALPKVDFSKEMVIIAAVPQSDKSNMVLREVNDRNGKIVVNYALSSAEKGNTSSFHFAVIKKTANPVVWEKGK